MWMTTSHSTSVWRQISPLTTPKLAAAVRTSVNGRGEGGTGWSYSVPTFVSLVPEAAGIDKPVACRYAFAGKPPVNLVNGDDLPASPFKTDDGVQ